MSYARSKHTQVSRRSGGLSVAATGLLLVFYLALSGCSSVIAYVPINKLSYERLSACYHRTKLRASSTLDVLTLIRSPQCELDPNSVRSALLSQSDTLIALSGQSKNTRKSWFNMVAFDEHTMAAKHKYFFCVDEVAAVSISKPKHYVFPPRKALIFDGQVVLDSTEIDQPYSTEEAKRIAVLNYISGNTRADLDELCGQTGQFSQRTDVLTICGMLVDQLFNAIKVQMDQSPVLATRLAEPQGVRFNHITFGKGRVQMTISGDIATIKVRVGLPM